MGKRPSTSPSETATAEDAALLLSQYEAVLQAAHCAILKLDADGHMLSASAAVCALLDCTQDDILHEPLADFLAAGTTVDLSLANGASQEVKLETRSGKIRWIRLTYQPAADDALLCFLQDITDQKETELSLAQQHNLLRTIIDHIPDFISAKNHKGEYILSNRAHARLLGADDPSSVLGKRAEDVLPPALASRFNAEDDTVLHGTNILNEERAISDLSNDLPHDVYWVSASKVPLYNDDGHITGIVNIARDITAMKLQEQELQSREKLYRTTARNLPNAAVLLFDDQMTLRLAEGQALDKTLYPREEIEGKDFREVLRNYTDDADRLIAIYEDVLDGYEADFEIEADGEYHSVHAIPVYDDAGNIFAGIVLSQNIDDLKRSQQALEDSEQRTRALLDAVPDMIFVIDNEGIYTEVHLTYNSKYLYHLSEDMIGQHFRDSKMLADVAYDIDRYLVLARKTERPHTFEYQFTTDEMTYDFEARMIALKDGEVLMLVRDITDLKRIQTELSQHIEDLTIMQQIDEELSDNLSLYNVTQLALDALIRLSNAQAGYIALMDNNDTLFPMGLIGHYDENRLRDYLRQRRGILARAMQKQQDEFVPDVHADPAYEALLDTTEAMIVIPLISNDRLIGAVCLEAHQTDRFSFERFQFLRLTASRVASLVENAQLHQQTESQLNDLQRLYEEVIKLEQLKTDMIRIASHDLKNPLAGIMGYLEMLRMNDASTLTDDQEKYIKHIHTSAQKMEHITTGILSLERIEQMASQQSAGSAFDLVQLVEETISEHEDEIAAKNQTLHHDLPSLPVHVKGDPILLHEAITNLIGNAIKYTPEGGTITVELQEMANDAQLRVHDTGYGIPKEQQKRLFTPFYRAHTRETSQIEGTGLGLHLVKNIIERHKGSMFVESEYGVGSIFGFDLPTTTHRDGSSDTGDISGSTVIR